MPDAMAHLPEYLIEAAGLGLFMVSACGFATLLGHPSSAASRLVPSPTARRALMGLAMGLTAVALIYSPWGERSGAHFNPATTWTFFRLGKVYAIDAVFYTIAQFVGAVAGVALSRVLLGGKRLADPSVGWVATEPGPKGAGPAFATEAGMAFVLMTVVLRVSNDHELARYTGLFAGTLVALYIALFAPLSGMSLNPARTFGSALFAGRFRSYWIYASAPLLGMLFAAEAHVRLQPESKVHCAKLNHEGEARCIFVCEGKP